MDLNDTAQLLGNFGEFVGAIAVVISLVYLAIQLRMNTKALRANAAWDSEVTYGSANMDIARDPQFAPLFAKASSASAKLSDFENTEIDQLYFMVRGALQYAQAQWWLWRSGSLPDELWEFRRRWAKNFVEAPVINSIWQAELEQHIFSTRFAQDILTTDRQGELSISPRRA